MLGRRLGNSELSWVKRTCRTRQARTGLRGHPWAVVWKLGVELGQKDMQVELINIGRYRGTGDRGWERRGAAASAADVGGGVDGRAVEDTRVLLLSLVRCS